MNNVKEKMKRQSIEIKKDVSLLVDSITNIIRSTIEQYLPQPNLHEVNIDVYSINKNIYRFEFWAKDEQVQEMKKIIYRIYNLKEEES